MKKLLLLLMMLVAASAFGQQGNTTTIPFNGVPTGSCAFMQFANDITNGDLYFCDQTNAWKKLSAGGGGGTPGAPVGSLQYNNGGSFGGISGSSVDATNGIIQVTGASAGKAYNSLLVNGLVSIGSEVPPTLVSAADNGAGSLSAGFHRWCLTATSTDLNNYSNATDVPIGETQCSNIVSNTVTAPGTNGSQLITFTNPTPNYPTASSLAYGFFNSIIYNVYRDDGSGFKRVGLPIGTGPTGPWPTTFVDNGGQTPTNSPPAVNTSYQIACSPWQDTNNPGNGNCSVDADVFDIYSNHTYINGDFYVGTGDGTTYGMHVDTSNNATFAGTVRIVATTVSGLPTCNGGAEGSQRPVTDSDTNTWGATVVHTNGSLHVLAYCDGSNWTVMGK